MRAVGRDADVFSDVSTVEEKRVGTGSSIDHVAAVTRVPDKLVVAGPQHRDIVAPTADNDVVAVAATQLIGALTADDHVVAGATVAANADHPGGHARRVDRVVAVTGVDH